jgi:hypothetical protein
VIILAMVHGKSAQADLTPRQRKDIAAALRTIGEQLKGEVP